VPIDPLTGFVDRTRELAQFRRMLSGETDRRILLIMERGEQGKTCFLLKLFDECEQQAVPVVLLNFDQRSSGLTDYLSVARQVRRHLHDECTPAICTCEEAIARGHPLVSIRTGEGDGGVDFGERGRFTGADISDVPGRDSIRVEVGNVSEAHPTVEQIAHQKATMGRALHSDLARLAAAHRRVVFLVDTFEHTPEETCGWLERWLFEPLRHELPHVLLVVAGRPECHAFFDQPRLWGSLVATIDRFDPFTDDDIRAHYLQRGLVIAEAEMSLLVDLARSESPAYMAHLGDRLEQTRGGTR
jgi:hypothetical protein